jgi:hypothetical protein
MAAMLPTDAQAAVQVLLDIMQAAAMVAVGPHATLTADERKMIVPPGGRIFARMSPEAASKLASVSDPLLLAVGMGFWLLRISRTGPRAAPSPPPPPTPAAPANAATRPPSSPVVSAVAVTVPGQDDAPTGPVDPLGVTPIPDVIRDSFGE